MTASAKREGQTLSDFLTSCLRAGIESIQLHHADEDLYDEECEIIRRAEESEVNQ